MKLDIKWSQSRATHLGGRPHCELTAPDGRRFTSREGDDVDKLGEVLADWLQVAYQDRLKPLADRYSGLVQLKALRLANIKGALVARVSGAYGIDVLLDLAKRIDLDVERVVDGRDQTIAFIVTDCKVGHR
jgi:hypothetical protein